MTFRLNSDDHVRAVGESETGADSSCREVRI